MEKIEKKPGLIKSVLEAIKSLGTDYASEERDLAKQVEEIEKVQKQIHEEQKNFGASLRVPKTQTVKTQTKTKQRETKQEDREIGD